MKELRREVEGLSLNFKDIRVGNPLCMLLRIMPWL